MTERYINAARKKLRFCQEGAIRTARRELMSELGGGGVDFVGAQKVN